MRRINRSELVSEYLLMRVYPPFSEDLIFHQMVNFLSFLLDYGKKMHNHQWITALYSIVRIFWIDLPLLSQLMDNLLWFVNFAQNFSRRKIRKVDYSNRTTIWSMR